jgi:hypothetical protein
MTYTFEDVPDFLHQVSILSLECGFEELNPKYQSIIKDAISSNPAMLIGALIIVGGLADLGREIKRASEERGKRDKLLMEQLQELTDFFRIDSPEIDKSLYDIAQAIRESEGVRLCDIPDMLKGQRSAGCISDKLADAIRQALET